MTIRFGDMDDVDLILDIEQSLAIKISPQESVSWRTFGEMYDGVAKSLTLNETSPCLSAFVFRQLRDSLASTLSDGVRLRPSSRLADLAVGAGWRRWRRKLEQESGIEIPLLPTAPHQLTDFRWWAAPVSAVISGGALHGFWGASIDSKTIFSVLMAIFAAAALSLFVFRRPHPDLTVGDLVRIAAPFNANKLIASRGSLRTSDLWTSLEALAGAHGKCEGPIDRDTRFEHVWPWP